MTNEERQAAYFNLIESLLNCPSGEEAAILTANLELVDAGLVEMMGEMAAQQEDENTANWLETLAQQLAEVFNLTDEEPLPNPFLEGEGTDSQGLEERFRFLMERLQATFPVDKAGLADRFLFLLEVLQATDDSDANPEVIYPLLAANIDKLDDAFTAILQQWATTTLAEAETDTATSLAVDIVNFSNLIQQFPLGSKVSNMEIAIAGYEVVATIFTQTAFPQDWAGTQNNLGAAYRNRIKGDKADNLELAITAYTAALTIRTETAFPQQWAATQNNLGAAYSDRIKGDKADNLELAITAFTAALTICTETAFPQDWAATQNNLGAAYSNRMKGDKADNLELAITAYTAALTIYTQTSFPQDWAGTQNNLGAAYRNRIKGEKTDNLEAAITAFTAALTIYTETALPQDWATTQNNLGATYSDRIKGDKADNLEAAITAFTAALTIRTQTALPQNYVETTFNLGLAYQKQRDFNAAYQTFTAAINTVEMLRGEIISGEDIKRKQSEEWNKLYRRMVEVCLELEKKTEAIEYVERSKTRTLVEALHKAKSEDAEQMTPIQYHEIQNLIDQETVIIEWYIFGDCFRAFIITHDSDKPKVWTSQPEDLQKLQDLVFDEYLITYYADKNHWQYQLGSQLQELAKILQIKDVLSLIPQHYRKLILIPHLYLHLLPLHALPLTDGEYLLDKFPRGVSYAPSCQMLRYGKKNSQTGIQQASENLLRNFFAIQNPSQDLKFTDLEVETIAAKFSPQQVLKHSQATKSALLSSANPVHLNNAQWLHFSCHGNFDLMSPLKSGLQLAGAVAGSNVDSKSSRYLQIRDDKTLDLEQCLTLAEIFKLNIPNCRLVCLSACETGMVDVNISDEYLSLSSGFIRAGATSVVSSLWAVSDFYTALLMIKFYEIIQAENNDIPLALNTAQKWFRDVKLKDFIAWVDGKPEINHQQKQEIKSSLEDYKPNEQPFHKPEAWAAFCAVGV